MEKPTYDLKIEVNVLDSMKKAAQSMMERLVEIAPYESYCTAAVKNAGLLGYGVLVEIRAAAGWLSGRGFSLNLHDALAQAEQKIREQLDEWRRTRFDGQSGPGGVAVSAA